MQLMFESCYECPYGNACYMNNFETCYRIQNASDGLGIPYKRKDDRYIKNVPFGVYMGLKHLIQRIERR